MYKIVSVESSDMDYATEELENKVNKFEKQGWKVHGGVSITCDSDDYFHVAQAMVKYEDAPNDSQDEIKVMA